MTAHDISAVKPPPTRISVAWEPFETSVAEVLDRLREDQFLVISVKRSNRFIQFAAQGSFGLRAEVVANAYLGPEDQIDTTGLAGLKRIGWHTPTGSPKESTPEQEPDGSPNHFIDCPNPFDGTRLAGIMAQTFRQVLGVHHPGFLEYEAFDANGKRLSFPGLGLQKVGKKAKANPSKRPADALLAAMRQVTSIADLGFDEDGDVTVVYADIVFFASLASDGSHARITACLATAVAASPELFVRMNEINALVRYVRISFTGSAVVGMAEVPFVPFVYDHLATVFVEMCRVARATSGPLFAEFSGPQPSGTGSPGSLKH